MKTVTTVLLNCLISIFLPPVVRSFNTLSLLKSQNYHGY